MQDDNEGGISRAFALQNEGHLEEAAREYRTVLQARIRELGPDHKDTTLTRRLLVQVLLGAGREDEAEREHRAAVESSTRSLGANDPTTLAALANHGLILHRLGRLDEAERAHLAVLEAADHIPEDRRVIIEAAQSNLAATRQAQREN